MDDQLEILRDLFERAKEIPRGPERDRWIDSELKDAPAMRAELLELLAAHAQAPSDLFESAKTETTKPSPIKESHRDSDWIGKRIDDYKILQKIGEGGFGLVFVAEQTRPVRRLVALKLLKPGMHSKEVLARFSAERQALALMEHPNIAKVYDAGETRLGLPYFAMELVRGEPINKFCERSKIQTRERLRLFFAICQAIHHAHQKGILHRDLKPSNVLIAMESGEPTPKVIDFGIAKALSGQLTEETLFTEFRQFLGTAAYMSPEQTDLRAMDIDTRSDIYSLGVLLYELLVGKPPFDNKQLISVGFDEMRRQIRETPPPKLSTRLTKLPPETQSRIAESHESTPNKLTHLLKGELDWIVMKALEKDRRRRYDSALAFSQDIQRFLDQQPVEAKKSSSVYKIKKYILRNRRWLAPTSIGVTALLIGLALTLRSTIAQIQEAKAQKYAEETVFLQEYATSLAEAASLQQLGALELSAKILDEYTSENLPEGRDDPRDFVWRYLRDQAGAKYKPQVLEPRATAYACAISPTQATFGAALSIGDEPQFWIKIWDVNTLTPRQAIPVSSLPQWHSLEYGNHGEILGLQTDQGPQFWRKKNGVFTQITQGPLAEIADQFSLSRTSALIAIQRGDGALQLRDYHQSQEKPLWSSEGFAGDNHKSSIKISPNGSWLAFQRRKDQIEIRSIQDFDEFHSVPISAEYSNRRRFLEFSPDETRLYFFSSDVPLHVYKIRENRSSPVIYDDLRLGDIAINESADQLLAPRLDIYDPRNLEKLLEFPRPAKAETVCAFLPRQNLALTGKVDGPLVVWDRSILTDRNTTDLNSLAWQRYLTFVDNESKILVSLGDFSVNHQKGVYDVRHDPPALVERANGDLTAEQLPETARFDTDFDFIAAFNDTLYFIKKPKNSIPVARAFTTKGPVRSVTLSGDIHEGSEFQRELTISNNPRLHPNQTHVAAGLSNGALVQIDIETGAIQTFKTKHRLPVFQTGYSKHGRWIATTESRSHHNINPSTWEFSGEILVHQPSHPERPAIRLKESSNHAWKLAFNPDETILAVGSYKGTISLWELPSGRLIGELNSVAADNNGLAFSPDGKTLAAATGSYLEFWHVASMTRLFGIKTEGKAAGIAFSQSGSSLAYTWGPIDWLPDRITVIDLESGLQ